MNEKFSISIDKPCYEDFNTFSPTSKGNFCNSCQKAVIDFTKVSDDEILNYFSTPKKNTCGLFRESQLKTYSDVNSLKSQHKPNRFFSGVFGYSFLSILSLSSYAQEKTKKNETVNIEIGINDQYTDSLDVNQQKGVTGIISSSAIPLPGASIYLKGKDIGTQTDVDGKFTFPTPLKKGEILVVAYIGLKPYEIIVTQEDMYCNISLKDYEMQTLGEVATTTIYRSKRSVFQKLKSLFTYD